MGGIPFFIFFKSKMTKLNFHNLQNDIITEQIKDAIPKIFTFRKRKIC